MTTQTEAERLADALERQFPTGTAQGHLDGEAAAELRRLVSFNQQLMDEVARLQKREPLTDEQLNDLADRCTPNTETGTLKYRVFARAIEAAHGITKGNT